VFQLVNFAIYIFTTFAKLTIISAVSREFRPKTLKIVFQFAPDKISYNFNFCQQTRFHYYALIHFFLFFYFGLLPCNLSLILK